MISSDSGKSLEDPDTLARCTGTTDHDATMLKIGVIVPPTANCLALSYRFLSDEFPEFVEFVVQRRLHRRDRTRPTGGRPRTTSIVARR